MQHSHPLHSRTGRHLLVDISTGIDLTDAAALRGCLEQIAVACELTVVGSAFHSFGLGAGVTGVLILAESHIAVHTWPEHGVAALDLFTCGDRDPQEIIPLIATLFKSSAISTQLLIRSI
jgi:S-adenosylmethionine decarboxylase